MRPLVVAQCPGGPVPPTRALEGSASGARLARMAGLSTTTELLERVDTINLLEANPGGLWPLQEARERAMYLYAERMVANQRVILLGRAVRDAFGYWNDRVNKLDYFRWVLSSGVWWAYSPHPSGLSRAWNDLDVRVGGHTFWHAVAG